MGDEVYIAAVDCTGHGVPGALISLIGYFLLNDIVKANKGATAGMVLDMLNEGVVRTLRQDENSRTRDGMDIALMRIHLTEHWVEYAGAHRPLMFIRNGELNEIRGNKFPIGGSYKTRTNFDSHRHDLQPGDTLVVFSDGLPDQFGGPDDRKLGIKRIRHTLLETEYANMDELHKLMKTQLEHWKGSASQTDDIIVIGIHI